MKGDGKDERLFVRALVEGTGAAFAEWLASGPESVSRLRRHLSREHLAELPEGTSPRDLLDNTTAAAVAAASRFPEDFLREFGGSEWDRSPSVIHGLGAIKTPEVTRRLMRLMGSDDRWVRVDVSVALAGHRRRGLRSVLLQALDDPDDLVRYHVAERLSELDADSEE